MDLDARIVMTGILFLFVKNYCQVVERSMRAEMYPLMFFQARFGIVGESGSGKSTLMQCLYFDQNVTSGEAYLAVAPGMLGTVTFHCIPVFQLSPIR